MKNVSKLLVMMLTIISITFLISACQKKETSNFRVLDESLDAEEYGIGFRINDIALGLKVQETIDEMIDDNTAADISKEWFGEDILLKNSSFIKESVAPAGDQSLQAILDKGSLVLGLDDNFPPMGFRDEQNKIVGFDIDLATEVAKRLGVELVLQPIDWDAKELELSTGRIDCIWNGMTINQNRIDNLFFAKAYIANRQIVIVPNDSDIKSINDLSDKIVGLQKGSSSLDALNKHEVSHKVKNIVELLDNVTVFVELQARRIDAFVVDEVAGRYIISNQ